MDPGGRVSQPEISGLERIPNTLATSREPMSDEGCTYPFLQGVLQSPNVYVSYKHPDPWTVHTWKRVASEHYLHSLSNINVSAMKEQ